MHNEPKLRRRAAPQRYIYVVHKMTTSHTKIRKKCDYHVVKNEIQSAIKLLDKKSQVNLEVKILDFLSNTNMHMPMVVL